MAHDAVYPWQREQWRRLVRNRAADRLSHALLIAGPGGTGLRAFAEAWSQALLCRAGATAAPCGACRGCHLYAAGTHPDALHIEPSEAGKAISIDAIRALTERLALTGSDATKVALIDPAEALTTAAANSVLKTLEEPPGGAHLVLVSRRVARLPATVRSRCQRMAFGLPEHDTALQWLQAQAVDGAETWLARAGGAPVWARDYARADTDTGARAETAVDRLLTALERGAVPSAAHGDGDVPLTVSVPALTAAVEDLLRLQYAPQASHLRWPEHRERMQALVAQLDGPALFDYLEALYRSVPGASSSLRADTQYLGLLADGAAIGTASSRSRG